MGIIRRDLDALVETVIYLYTESRRLTKGMAAGFGLTGPQLTVLKLLESFPDLSLSSLSERIRAQNSTVSGIIDRMERESLVKRERSPQDRRVTFIRLTEKGQKVARQIKVEPMEVFRGAMGSLTREEMRDLLRLLRKVESAVRAQLGEERADIGSEEASA